jgi:hypothetical protein
MSSRTARQLAVGASWLVLAAVVVACSPVEGGPPDMADVEDHLGLTVGYLPEGCHPVGLDGDGRGTIVGAAFDCAEGTGLRIERFDAESNDEELSSSPAATSAGRVEWRDGRTRDVIRVSSDDLAIDLLMKVADSIEVRD